MPSKKILPLLGLFILLATIVAQPLSQPQRKLATPPQSIPATISTPFHPQYTANSDPATSISTIAHAIGLSQFTAQTHTTGQGQTVAIIDSGLDVGHPDFCPINAYSPKIAQYYDLTDEGRLTTQITSHYNQQIHLGNDIYRIGTIPNKLPQYRLAQLAIDSILPTTIPPDGRTIGVLVTASTAEAYDTIYLDTDNDRDFSDEQPLGCYNDSHNFATITSQNSPINLALTALDTTGQHLQLTSDLLGHGTFIAGILGANGVTYQGLAPKCQLIAYKIFDKNGASAQSRLTQALHMAIEQHVDLINLSLSLPADEAIEPQLLAAIAQVQAADIPIIAAAGNYGGGLHSDSFPANQPGIISAGSIITPAMCQIDQHMYLPGSYIPSYSSRGPSPSAQVYPTLIAPGAATAPVPTWKIERHMFDEGTSIAAAVTAAAIVHAQEYAHSRQQHLSTRQLINILAISAQPLDQPITAQGHGQLNMTNFAKIIQAQPQPTPSPIITSLDYYKTRLLETISLKPPTIQLKNQDTIQHTIHWMTHQPWPTPPDTILAPGQTAPAPVNATPDPSPGDHSTIQSGTIDHDTYPSIHLPQYRLIPYPTATFTHTPLIINANIPQGQSQSYYLDIPPDTSLLTARIQLATTPPTNPQEHLIAQGRCQMTLYDPTGKRIHQTPHIGATYSDTLQTTAQTIATDPIPGIWQLLITSNDHLSQYNHFTTQATITIKATPQ